MARRSLHRTGSRNLARRTAAPQGAPDRSLATRVGEEVEGEAADARTERVMVELALALVADAHRGSAGSSCLWVQLRCSEASFSRNRLTILPRSSGGSGGGGGGTVGLGAAQSLTLQRDDLGERVVHLANALFDGLQATVVSFEWTAA